MGEAAFSSMTAAAEGFELRLLGPIEAASGGNPLPVGGPRQRALLAFLLLHANEVVTRDRLVDALWGERAPVTAANALQVAVHALRRLLGVDRIQTHGTSYLLRVEPGELDLHRATRLVAQARAETPSVAAETLRAALGLWRGPALADVGDAPFAPPARARLEELRLAATEAWLDAELALGRHAQVIGEIEALLAGNPYREALHRRLMLALYRSGRQAEALAAYQRVRRVLVEELGLEPGEELQELEASILRQDPNLAARAPASGRRSNLPAPATALIGRELELAAVTGLLRRGDVRLLTLTGPGGTGKTRLAIEVASALASELEDGVVFVDLAPITDPGLVAATVARALGVGEGSLPVLDSLRRGLRDASLLLVLDNFERVDEAAPLVSELLAAAPTLRVLATSRAVLRLSGEHEYAVPPLRAPAAEARDVEGLARNEAVALFTARAAAARHDFRLTEQNAGAVAEICRALDGLPLALELAAARIKLLSPAALLGRLEQRLDVLIGGPRDVPARQRTLRATIDWSYDLLEPTDKQLFAALAVFAGGFTLDAAAAVCGAAPHTFVALVDRSLVQGEEAGAGDPRFRMLETVREYARERLEAGSDAEELRRRHAAYFLDLAEEAGRVLWQPVQGPERGGVLDRLEADHDNFRAALEWADQHDAETGLRLSAGLGELWAERSYFREGRSWLERFLARPGASPVPLLAKALHGASYLALGQGDYERCKTAGEEALSFYRELGDREGAGRTVHLLAWAATEEGDHERAVVLAQESLSLARELGHTRGVIVSLSNLGRATARLGAYERAAALLEEGLELAREHGDRTGISFLLVSRGELAAEQGDHVDAARHLGESLRIYREAGNVYSVAVCMHRLALLEEARGGFEAAARLFGAAERLRESIHSPLQPTEQALYEAAVARARATLGETFDAAWAGGRALSLDEAVSLALETAGGTE